MLARPEWESEVHLEHKKARHTGLCLKAQCWGGREGRTLEPAGHLDKP